MSKGRELLVCDSYFHIYNHAVGDEVFFREEKNYHFFLEKFSKWVLPCTSLLSYCLMPNHFHLLVRIKSEKYLEKLWTEKISKRLQLNNISSKEQISSSAVIEKLINEQFSHCFNSYAQAFNKMYSRKGALMREGFERKKINSPEYLRTLICYIHNNPVKHGFTKQAREWEFSSYNSFVLNNSFNIEYEEVMNLFDSIDNFIYTHQVESKRSNVDIE